MWDYTEKVMEHYRNPKNVGSIENPTVIGEAGSLSCGDMLKIYLKIDENNIIQDAKFQTFGCGSAVASSSVLTEMIIGKTLEEAKKITNKDIADALGGLPAQKMHCSVMGYEALENAISKLENNSLIENDNFVNEKIICSCFNVSEKTIIDKIKNMKLKTFDDVSNLTNAGNACGNCKNAIENLLLEFGGVGDNESNNCNNLNHTQLVLKVNNVIETIIAPALRRDNGDIELIDVDNNIVVVKLKGSCNSCKNSLVTLKNFVELTLREHVCENIEVVRG